MRFHFIGLLIAIVLLIIVVALPSKRDTSVAAWWARVRFQFNFFARAALVLALLGAVTWFLLVPMLRTLLENARMCGCQNGVPLVAIELGPSEQARPIVSVARSLVHSLQPLVRSRCCTRDPRASSSVGRREPRSRAWLDRQPCPGREWSLRRDNGRVHSSLSFLRSITIDMPDEITQRITKWQQAGLTRWDASCMEDHWTPQPVDTAGRAAARARVERLPEGLNGLLTAMPANRDRNG